MKRNRLTLVAEVLALGVAACGDDVQVAELDSGRSGSRQGIV